MCKCFSELMDICDKLVILFDFYHQSLYSVVCQAYIITKLIQSDYILPSSTHATIPDIIILAVELKPFTAIWDISLLDCLKPSKLDVFFIMFVFCSLIVFCLYP